MLDMKEKIFNTIDNIRNLLSKPFIFNELTKDTIKFNKCYASLDILEDSEQAIDYYKNTDFEIDNYGQKYLFIYGLFEAFYIQEQAIRCVIEIANINNDNVKIELGKLGNIKELRNDIAGHPAFRDRKNYSTYLSQPALLKEEIKYRKSDGIESITINITEEINTQEKCILDILSKILEQLIEIEKEHYLKFKEEKLNEIFEKNYLYPREKIFNENDFEFALTKLKQIICNLKSKLNERFYNWEKLNTISYLIKYIDKNFEYFDNNKEEIITDSEFRGFIIKKFIENLIHKFDELEEITLEIDNEYENYFKEKEDIEIVMPKIKFIGFESYNI